MVNALWHLRVSSNASGRGVLRLIKLNYCIRLLSIPALLIQLAILAMPMESMPSALCLYLEWTVGFMRVNHYLGGLAIALSRQVLLNMVECKLLSVSQEWAFAYEVRT